MNWDQLIHQLQSLGQTRWADSLERQKADWLVNHGDYPRWAKALASLPDIEGVSVKYDSAAIRIDGVCHHPGQLEDSLLQLMPWRKGPYQISDCNIDSEWRSDFKWDRVQPHLASLESRRLLDIGCGNGYHCWRMLAENPELVIGIEPSPLFNLQFQAVQRYAKADNIHMLPIGIEAIPDQLNWFDTVFSMGVLYHRRSPVDHLYQLKSFLRPGGELCLETLVIPGGEGEVLVPDDRYARMRNVWFIPSAPELCRWMRRCGFVNVRVVDETLTTTDEQRSTGWMQFESLEQCLDAENPAMTVEGLPAPRRAVIIANNP
ncbi:MAG: tRNA (mo5U34)-methyltransferase [Planctomycetota bacterium]|jgi:tRNA (mo5U34)-methyltransferase